MANEATSPSWQVTCCKELSTDVADVTDGLIGTGAICVICVICGQFFVFRFQCRMNTFAN